MEWYILDFFASRMRDGRSKGPQGGSKEPHWDREATQKETIKNEFRALSELVTSLPQHLSLSISQSLNSLLSLLPLREHGRSF